jgi:serine/threonine protein kinase
MNDREKNSDSELKDVKTLDKKLLSIDIKESNNTTDIVVPSTDLSYVKFEQCAPIALGEEWSCGAFGSVHVVDTPTGKIAVKRVPELLGHINRELDTCTRLASDNHPNIVQLLGFWTENMTPDKRCLYLVMEFMPETLGNVLERLVLNKMRMKQCKMNAMMGQLASALDHLEQINLMHRDLKPDNILVNVDTNRVVLADFGSAKFIEEGQPNVTYVCTRFYRAPCLILGRDIYSTSVDIWSFGCVLAEFAYGSPLFRGDDQIDVMARIIKIRGMMTLDDIAHMPTHCPETIEMDGIGLRCNVIPWSKVFTKRLGDKRVNTSYGENYEHILDDCLQWNPLNRISAYDLARNKAFTRV